MSNDRVGQDGLAALEEEYEILSEIGRGGVSVVYLARDRVLGREVAIKVIRDRFLEDAEARIRVDQEARTLAQLDHPGIVSILAARRLADGTLALVMQYARGHTLRMLLEQVGQFPPEAVLKILRELAAALGYLHQRGIVHRDVKPENVFVEEDGRVLLSDLGIAKANDGSSNLTLAGVLVGTPAYMSPEQIDGTTLDGRSDLYSLGLLGYELLSGKRHWEGESLFQILIKQKAEALPPLETIRSDVPFFLRLALERALAKEPGQRWADMEEFIEELKGETHRLARPLPPLIEPPTPPAATGTAVVPLTPAALIATANEMVVKPEPDESPVTVFPRSRTQPRVLAAAAIILAVLLGGGLAVALAPPAPWEQADLSASAAMAATPDEADALALDGTLGAEADPAPVIEPTPVPEEQPRVPAARRIRPPTLTVELPSADAFSSPAPVAATVMPRSAPIAPPAPRSVVRQPGAPSIRTGAEPEAVTSARMTAPALRNAEVVAGLVRQSYPAALVQQNAAGTVILSLEISERGRVTSSEVHTSSGHPELDALALRVSRQMQFSPARRDGAPVEVSIQVPLTIQP
jgi:TonB family protein